MLISDRYYELTERRYVYNIMPMNNIESVISNGLLCYHEAERLPAHSSIAMNDVQERREAVHVRGKSLHDYANMYFSYRNPMMYKRRMQAEILCVLAIDIEVLDIDGCIVTDQNAASTTARFYDADVGIDFIDFERVFADSWVHENAYEMALHKKIKCAEILVPESVPFDYIVGAYVVNDDTKRELIKRGFQRKIGVKPSAFFR